MPSDSIVHHIPEQSYIEAQEYLTLLDEETDQFTFLTFDDNKQRRKAQGDKLVRELYGTLDEHFNSLVSLNNAGAGIFVMVQRGDGKGRKSDNVTSIRCIFNENDDGLTNQFPIDPHFIVESSPNKYHYYFLCDGLGIDEFKPVMQCMVNNYGSDHRAMDTARVLRVAGFYHQKGERHRVKVIHQSGALPYKREKIITAFPPALKQQQTTPENPTKEVLSIADLKLLRSALNFFDAYDYELWIKFGHCLAGLGAQGRGLWFDWSQSFSNYDAGECGAKWSSFSGDHAGYRGILKAAYDLGWDGNKKEPVTDVTSVTGLTWSCADTLADNAKAPSYLINNILETDSHGMLAGDSMAFKTFVDLRMAYSVCTGVDFFGHEVFETGKVLYICGEGKGALSRRIKALKIVESDFKGNLMILDNNIRIDDSVNMAALRAAILIIDPILVIFDTFGSLIGNTDENSNSDVGKVLNLIKETCRNKNTCSLTIHHFGKDATKGMRGAIAFKANVDFEMSLEREKETMITTLSSIKMKDGEGFKPLTMQAHIVDLGLIRQDGTSSTSLVIKAAPDGFVVNKGTTYLQDQILLALKSAIDEIGGNFYHNDIISKSITIDDFRPIVYPLLKVSQNSKRNTLKRELEKLCDNGKILNYKDNLIIIDDNTSVT